MIGDNAAKDITGAKTAINAVTIQKIHPGVTLGTGDASPDCSFDDFAELRALLLKID
jgi:putative hydrolase of the HAD superfamily